MVHTGSPRLPIIAITMGDPSGIGPEVVVRAMSDPHIRGICRPVVFGVPWIIEQALEICRISAKVVPVQRADTIPIDVQPGVIPCIPTGTIEQPVHRWGVPSEQGDRAQVASVEAALDAIQSHSARAMVTAPIRKEALRTVGLPYPGHTELLADRTSTEAYAMMLAGPRLRVVPVTGHCPLSHVPARLTRSRILVCIRLTHRALQRYFNIPVPRIAVAGLNPHSGEDGLMGTEERELIQPAVEQARMESVRVEGPLPPDIVYSKAAAGEFDAVVGMYHDQALIPLKLLHFDEAVNVTLGLPIVRTSPDHGTAFDIAGKGTARPHSMIAALRLAVEMARRCPQGSSMEEDS